MFPNSTNDFILGRLKDKPLYPIASLSLSLLGEMVNVCGIVILAAIISIAFVEGDLSFFNGGNFLGSVLGDLIYGLSEEPKRIVLGLSLLFVVSKIIISINSIIEIEQRQDLIYTLRSESIFLLTKVNWNYFTNNKKESTLLKINREIDKSVRGIIELQGLSIATISVFLLSLILAVVSLPLSLMAGVLVLSWLWLRQFWQKKFDNRESTVLKVAQTYNRQIVDFILGMRQVKLLTNETAASQQIVNSLKSRQIAELDRQKNRILVDFILDFLLLIIFLTITVTSYFLYSARMQQFSPILVIFLFILARLITLILKIYFHYQGFIASKSSIKTTINFLTEINQTTIKSGMLSMVDSPPTIELNNVTFAYPHRARIILDKLNLKIIANQTTALLGVRGAGKTTLVNLLTRFYEPLEGKITIDGVEIQAYDLVNLRQAIAIISSEVFLFNNSILDNLTYGLKNISYERIIAASKTTKIHDFITQLPAGFNTPIDDRRIALSEVQKLGIAATRALLGEPKIIILDNPWQDLSLKEREIIQPVLNELCRDRTTIIISDRLDIIKTADTIAILHQGKIAESGTHQQLLKTSNLYRHICSIQFKSNQQSQHQRLAKKISKKLARQNKDRLSTEIDRDLNSLFNYLQLLDYGAIEDDREESRILDESSQSAKNILSGLREYQRKISQGFKKK